MKCLLLAALLSPLLALTAQSQTKTEGALSKEYDRFTDRTTLSINPIKVWGTRFPAVNMSATAVYDGSEPPKDDSITVSFTVIDRTRRFATDSGLYLILDGERTSTNAAERKTPEPLLGWEVDTASFTLPIIVVSQIANARVAEIRVGGIEFRLTPAAKSAIQRLLEALPQKPQPSIPRNL